MPRVAAAAEATRKVWNERTNERERKSASRCAAIPIVGWLVGGGGRVCAYTITIDETQRDRERYE